MTRSRAVLVALFGALLAGGLVLATGSQPASVAVATTADLSGFDAGNIIDDDVYFDSGAMSATAVQAFLVAKGANCTAGSLCLKNYAVTTATKAADAYCAKKYTGAAAEKASTVIAKVSAACGINPQVLLVLLQKEQGLVTATAPTSSRYRIATGFGCPDTAACDTQYYGFFNQLYNAAHQFQRYSVLKTYKYRAGVTNAILYSPTSSCGSSKVFIENQATANLYNYTPYQPNKAALAAGYGSGDSCSAYGNRNFFNYFTDWFGSTHSKGGSAISGLYGTQVAALGAISTNVVCNLSGGGCSQDYANGSIYWTKKTGAHYVLTSLRAKFLAVGGVSGDLGYPTADTACTSTGCAQTFAGGAVYRATSATKAYVSGGKILAKYQALGALRSALGYPINDTTCGLRDAGCWQKFTGGRIYYQSSAGTHWLSNGAVMTAWQAADWEDGALLYPTADIATTTDGKATFVDFQGGSVYSAPSVGAAQVLAPSVVSTWLATGAGAGPLGYPTAALTTAAGGKVQQFQRGGVYWSATTGWRAIGGGIYDSWSTAGGVASSLGYPTSSVTTSTSGAGYGSATGQWATFSGGRLFWTAAGGAHQVGGAALTAWTAAGGTGGSLGFPVSDAVASSSGSASGQVLQRFQSGLVYSSSRGTFALGGPVYRRWMALGGATGPVGVPTSNLVQVPGGQWATFTGGSVAWSSATSTRWLGPAITAKWKALGGPGSALRFPTADQVVSTGAGGARATFQGGVVATSTKTGTHWLGSAIASTWVKLGAQKSELGYPTTDQHATSDGKGLAASFSGGVVFSAKKTGTHWVGSTITKKWQQLAWQNGALGYPTGDQKKVSGGVRVTFQHGTITYTTKSKKYAVAIT